MAKRKSISERFNENHPEYNGSVNKTKELSISERFDRNHPGYREQNYTPTQMPTDGATRRQTTVQDTARSVALERLRQEQPKRNLAAPASRRDVSIPLVGLKIQEGDHFRENNLSVPTVVREVGYNPTVKNYTTTVADRIGAKIEGRPTNQSAIEQALAMYNQQRKSDTENYFADKDISQKPVNLMSNEEKQAVKDEFESIPNYNVFETRADLAKNNAYERKQELYSNYRQVKNEDAYEALKLHGMTDNEIQMLNGNPLSTEEVGQLKMQGKTDSEIEQLANARTLEIAKARDKYEKLLATVDDSWGVTTTDIANMMEDRYANPEVEKMALESPVASSIYSLAANPIESAAEVGANVYNYATGRPIQNYQTGTELIRNAITEDIDNQFGRTVYGGAMSIGDMAVAMGFAYGTGGGSIVNAGIQALEKAAQTMGEGVDRGLNPDQIFAEGIASGVTTYLTEKVPYGMFEKVAEKGLTNYTAKEIGKYLGSMFMSEGLQEASEDVADWAVDSVVAWDKNEFNTDVQNYISQGMRPEDAVLKVISDRFVEATTDFVIGGIGGAHMGTVSTGIAYGLGRVNNNPSVQTDLVINELFDEKNNKKAALNALLNAGKTLDSSNLQGEDAERVEHAKEIANKPIEQLTKEDIVDLSNVINEQTNEANNYAQTIEDVNYKANVQNNVNQYKETGKVERRIDELPIERLAREQSEKIVTQNEKAQRENDKTVDNLKSKIGDQIVSFSENFENEAAAKNFLENYENYRGINPEMYATVSLQAYNAGVTGQSFDTFINNSREADFMVKSGEVTEAYLKTLFYNGQNAQPEAKESFILRQNENRGKFYTPFEKKDINEFFKVLAKKLDAEIIKTDDVDYRGRLDVNFARIAISEFADNEMLAAMHEVAEYTGAYNPEGYDLMKKVVTDFMVKNAGEQAFIDVVNRYRDEYRKQGEKLGDVKEANKSFADASEEVVNDFVATLLTTDEGFKQLAAWAKADDSITPEQKLTFFETIKQWLDNLVKTIKNYMAKHKSGTLGNQYAEMLLKKSDDIESLSKFVITQIDEARKNLTAMTEKTDAKTEKATENEENSENVKHSYEIKNNLTSEENDLIISELMHKDNLDEKTTFETKDGKIGVRNNRSIYIVEEMDDTDDPYRPIRIYDVDIAEKGTTNTSIILAEIERNEKDGRRITGGLSRALLDYCGSVRQGDSLRFYDFDDSRRNTEYRLGSANKVLSRTFKSARNSENRRRNFEQRPDYSRFSFAVTDPDILNKVNSTMTMDQARDMIKRAFVNGGIKDYYEGEIKTADEWLEQDGAEMVAMTVENDYALYQKYLSQLEGLNDDYVVEDIIKAYQEGTLTGGQSKKKETKRLDVSKDGQKNDQRFYAPKEIKEYRKLYDLANTKITSKNKAEVTKARASVLMFAHNKGAADFLGITDAELNKALRKWGNYSASARDISMRINAGASVENRWTGIENISWLNRVSVSNEELNNLCGEIKGDSNDNQRAYIVRTMCALDTHIDYTGLNFTFTHKPGQTYSTNGSYSDYNRTILVKYNAPNTIAHEIGHFIDYLWGREISNGKLARPLTELVSTKTDFGREDINTWANNFKNFIEDLEDVSSLRNAYAADRKEVFARFVSKFVQWADTIANGVNGSFRESLSYDDKFTQAQFVEFARLLQEKSLLNLSEYGNGEVSSDDTNEYRYSVKVEDPEMLKFLNNQDHVKTYRSFQLIDGGLYAPMNAMENGKLGYKSVIGQWEQATEAPDKAKLNPKNGNYYFDLKAGGYTKSGSNRTTTAAYNPYLHSSNIVFNDQFAAAYDRPNLVVVECEVPSSELTSGYHAEKAKDPVGWLEWKSGSVSKALKKKGIERKVMLSRWMKPVRILDNSEVAQMYKEALDGTTIEVPWNVVSPPLLEELQKLDVKIDYGYQSQVKASYEDKYGDIKHSFGVHAGDLGKSEGFWQMTSSRRGTGHFGTGTYFVGDEEQINKYGYDNRPHEKVDFDNYNLFKPKNYKEGMALHEALKFINNSVYDYDVLKDLENIEKDLAWLDVYGMNLYHETDVDKAVDGLNKLYDKYGKYLSSYEKNRLGDREDYKDETDFLMNFSDYGEEIREGLEDLQERFDKSVSDLANALGISEDKARQQMLDVLEECSKIEDAYHEARYADSPSTRFMKAFGYEGIDVRDIKQMDNVEYGSVIYDLKGDDLKRKQEIGTARYSFNVPVEDSKGRTLSEGQQRKFAESQARDEEGHLMEMYHGTPGKEFYVFDNKYSKDKRSFFFSSDKRVSETYANGGTVFPVYLDLRNPLIVNAEGKYWNKIKYDEGKSYKINPTRLGENIFLTKEDADAFEKKYNYTELLKALEIAEEEDSAMYKGEETDVFELEEIFDEAEKEYKEYHYQHSRPITFRQFFDNYQNYSWRDFYAVLIGYDRNSPSLDEVKQEGSYEDVVESTRQFFEEENLEESPDFFDEMDASVLPVMDEEYTEEFYANTRRLAKMAEEAGRDGVIIRNVIDTANADAIKSDVMIAFKSNQIKSIYNLNPTDSDHTMHSFDVSGDDFFDSFLEVDEEVKKTESQLKEMIEKQMDLDSDVSKKMISDVTSYIKKKYNSNIKKDSLEKSITAVFKYLQNNNAKMDDILYIMSDITKPMLQDVKSTDPELEKLYKDFVAKVKTYKIALDNYQRQEVINTYGTYKNFVDSMRGKITLDKKGVSLDSIWTELCDASGGMLSYGTNPNDQPIALANLINALNPAYASLEGQELEDASLDAALEIIRQFYVRNSLTSAAETIQGELTKRANKFKNEYKQKYNEALKQVEAEKALNVKRLAEEIDKLTAEEQEAIRNGDALNKAMIENLRNDYIKRLERLRAESNNKIARAKAQYRNAWITKNLNRERSELKNRVLREVKALQNMIAHPSEGATKHVPINLIKPTIEMLEAINLDNGGRNKAIAERLKKMSEVYESFKNDDRYSFDYDERIANDIKELRELFEGKSYADLGIQELERVIEIVTALKTQIKNANNLILQGKYKDAQEAAKNAMNEVRGSRRYDNEAMNVLNRYANVHLNAYREFRKLSGYKDGSLMEIYRDLDEGSHKEMQIQKDLGAIFQDVLEGQKNQKEVKKFISTKKEDLVDIGITDNNGKPILITKAMRMSLIMHSMNAGNMRHVLGSGITVPNMYYFEKGKMDEAYAKGTNYRFVDYNELLDAIVRNDQNKIDELTTAAQERIEKMKEDLSDWEKDFLADAEKMFHDETGKLINETSMALKGYAIARVKNYFPIKTDPHFTSQDWSGLIQNGSLEGAGSLKERVISTKPILLEDITNVIERQIRFTSKYAGLAIAVRNFDTLMKQTSRNQTNGQLQNLYETIDTVWGASDTKWLRNLMQDIQGGRSEKGNWLMNLRGQFAGATLTLNPSVAIKQAASYPTAASVVGWKALGRAASDIGKGFGGKGLEELERINPLLWYRAQGFGTQELADAKAVGFGKNLPAWAQKAINWTQWFDTGTVRTLEYAAKYYVDDNFKDLKGEEYWQKVSEVFTNIVEQTQPNYSTLHKADIIRNPNSFVKMLVMFKTQPMQNFGIIYDAMGELNAAKINGNKQWINEASSKAAKAISSQVVSATVFSAMTILSQLLLHRWWKYRDEDGKWSWEKFWVALGEGALSCVTGAFIGGTVIYDLLKAMFTEETTYGIEISVVEMVNDLRDNISKLYKNNKELLKAKTSEDREKLTQKELKYAINVASSIGEYTGTPVNNIKNIVSSMYFYATDIIKSIDEGKLSISDDSNLTTWEIETQYERIYQALNTGDDQKYEKLVNELKEKTKEENPGLNEDEIAAKVEEDVTKNITSLMKTDSLEGNISDEEMSKYLQEEKGKTEDEAYYQMREWQTGESKYGVLKDTINSASADPTPEKRKAVLDEIDDLLAHGTDKGTIAKTITSNYKDKYIDLYNRNKAADLNAILRAALVEAGYTDEQAKKKLNDWVK